MITKDLITLVVKSDGVDKVTVDFDKLAKGVKQIELEAKDAKGAIRILEEENNKLSASIKREGSNIKLLSKQMRELAKEKDTNAKKIQALSEAQENSRLRIQRYNSQIIANKEAIRQAGYMHEYLMRNMKITDMTATQLGRRADYLRGKLNNIVKEKDLAKWNKYNSELIQVKAQQDKVAIGGEQVKNRFDKLSEAAQNAGKTLSKVFLLMAAYSVLRFFQDLVANAREWTKEAVAVASKAEGVARAFESMSKPGLLDKLRTQTRGLIGDFELMQASVKADKYRIPITEVGNLLEFASRRAIDMGKDVDDFQKRIIDGIGKQSKLILDDLGFSGAEINKAIAKQGTFAKGVISLVNAELEKQGPRALTAADMATQASVKWKNAQQRVGDNLLWIDKLWSQLSGSIADKVNEFATNQLPKLMGKLGELYNWFVDFYNNSLLLRTSIQFIGYGFNVAYNNAKLFFDFGINSAVLLGKTLKAAMTLNPKELSESFTEYFVRQAKIQKQYLESTKKDFESYTKGVSGSRLEYYTHGSNSVDPVESNYTDTGKAEKESKIIARQKKELDTLLQVRENAHKEELLKIRQYAVENNQTDEELRKEQLKSDYKYYADRMVIIEDFLDKYKITNKDFLADIDTKKSDTRLQQFELLSEFDTNRLATLQKNRDEQLRVIEITKNAQLRALQEQEESEEVYAVKSQAIELSALQLRLGVLNEYNAKVVESEFTNGRLKLETVREAGDALVVAEAETIQKRKDLEKKFRESNYNVRSQYGLTSIDEDKNRDLKVFQDLLAANVINYETYQKLLTQLNAKYESERVQVKERYGVASISEIYNVELENLRIQHEQGLLSEEEYEDAKFRMKMDYAAKYVEKYKLLQDAAAGMVNALVQAETANLDAEYDVRIAAAEGNAEEVERLENEKAQKKLEIEKKYADVQFAVKASEIIANTAVAIMTGFSQLGPIAGAVAAVMLGVTGTAQLASANAERQKVKNMTLGGSSSSSSKSARIVAGKQDGGHIDVEREQDGKRFDAIYDPDKRGFVDRPTVIVGEGPRGRSREWVASNALTENPTARPLISLLDEAQTSGRASTIDINRLARARMAGFETGGFFSQRQQARPLSGETRNTPSVTQSPSVVEAEMLELLRHLNAKGVRAIVGVTELEAEKKLKEDIDSKFTM